jgi:dTMP kinase
MSDPRGRFITLEGGEGAGKSTQARMLADKLRELGVGCVTTREPGGSPGAERLREALLSGLVEPLGPAAEAMVFSAARIDHLDALIRPALARGDWVICDRFLDSTRAYQGAQGKVDPTLLRALEKVVVGEDMPDLTLILDLPPETGVARAAARRGVEGADRFEKQDMAFHHGLREAFLAIAAEEPQRCVVIDADRTPELVARDIWSTVNRKLRPVRWQETVRSQDPDRTTTP